MVQSGLGVLLIGFKVLHNAAKARRSASNELPIDTFFFWLSVLAPNSGRPVCRQSAAKSIAGSLVGIPACSRSGPERPFINEREKRRELTRKIVWNYSSIRTVRTIGSEE